MAAQIKDTGRTDLINRIQVGAAVATAAMATREKVKDSGASESIKKAVDVTGGTAMVISATIALSDAIEVASGLPTGTKNFAKAAVWGGGSGIALGFVIGSVAAVAAPPLGLCALGGAAFGMACQYLGGKE